MEGVTHSAMRELVAARGGVGIVCTEFVRVTSNPLGNKAVRRHVVRTNHASLSVQVMGNDIAQMADATALVTEGGAHIVDINLGCPAPRVVRKGVGSAMLKDLKLLGQVLSAMRAATHLPISAKIRAGFDDASGVLDVALAVQDSGADFITVHPRRRADFYEGIADWRIIKYLVDHLSIPVVGNGDVWYASDALRMRKETGCAAVMIGRPALRNPWIFVQIAELESGQQTTRPNGSDILGYVAQMINMWTGLFPGKLVLGLLKEQVRYLLRATDPQKDLARRALRSQTMNELMQILEVELLNLGWADLDLCAETGRWERCGSALAPAEAGHGLSSSA